MVLARSHEEPVHKSACPWRVAEFATITCTFLAIRIIWRWRYLKNSKCRNAPYLPKDRSSKRNSVVIDSFLKSFIRESWLLSQDRRPEVHSMSKQTQSQSTISPVCASKGRFIFSKNHSPSSNKPTTFTHPPFLFKMAFNPEFQSYYFELFTFPLFLPHMHEYSG